MQVVWSAFRDGTMSVRTNPKYNPNTGVLFIENGECWLLRLRVSLMIIYLY
jgi:hypothetical protein